METIQILENFPGHAFCVVGPFLVADLSENRSLFDRISAGIHAMEDVSAGQKTQSHNHDFPSFYKSEGLDVENGEQRYSLPLRAVTLVLPGVNHSWVPKSGAGAVGSMDPRHEKQVVEGV